MAKITTQLRRVVAPLVTHCDITEAVGETYCPTSQTYDSATNTFTPSRTKKPTIIKPHVTIKTEDGSVDLLEVVAEMSGTWMINLCQSGDDKFMAIDDSRCSLVQGTDYVVGDGTTYSKHALVFKKDLFSGERYIVYWKGIYTDTRTGIGCNVEIYSNTLHFVTNVLATDRYTININNCTNLVYNPLYDNLGVFDYRLSQASITHDGIASSERETYRGSFSYERAFPITLQCGDDVVPFIPDLSDKYPNGYAVIVQRKTGEQEQWVTVAEADSSTEVYNDRDVIGLVQHGTSYLTIDLRFFKAAQYKIMCVERNDHSKEIASTTIYATFVTPQMGNYEIISGKRLRDGATTQGVMLKAKNSKNKEVEYIDLVAEVAWSTSITSGTVAYGSETIVPLGDADSLSCIEISASITPRGVSYLCGDGSSTVYTDSDGNVLII